MLLLLLLLLVPAWSTATSILDDIEHIGLYAAATYQRFEDWTNTRACSICQHSDIRNTEINATWSTAIPVASRGFVGIDHNRRHVVVAFRGTTHVMDVLADAQIAEVRWPNAEADGNESRVHAGFLAAYLSARDTVFGALDAIAADTNSEYSILFVGHSLGAAQATLAFADYAEHTDNTSSAASRKMRLITFGSPRVGNREFVRHVDRTATGDAEADAVHLRVVHEADVVPHLPRAIVPRLHDYAHSGREVWARDSETAPASDIVLCRKLENGKEDPACSVSVGPLRWNIADHFVYPGIRIGIPRYLVQKEDREAGWL
ncbi:hypothetical protein IWW48_003875 [Coemansia sp. RSA 1200]|nr:hypothetical protein IWW48_003875 [Coemansia sp. RSA 1200]